MHILGQLALCTRMGIVKNGYVLQFYSLPIPDTRHKQCISLLEPAFVTNAVLEMFMSE